MTERPEPVDDDDAITREELAARRYRDRDIQVQIRARRLRLAETRHQGDDGAAHHWAPVTRLRCPCGCQGSVQNSADASSDPLDILAAQVLDPGERYDRSYAEARAMLHGRTAPLTGEDALRQLESMRVRFTPRWPE